MVVFNFMKCINVNRELLMILVTCIINERNTKKFQAWEVIVEGQLVIESREKNLSY